MDSCSGQSERCLLTRAAASASTDLILMRQLILGLDGFESEMGFHNTFFRIVGVLKQIGVAKCTQSCRKYTGNWPTWGMGACSCGLLYLKVWLFFLTGVDQPVEKVPDLVVGTPEWEQAIIGGLLDERLFRGD